MNTEKPRVSYSDFANQRMDAWLRAFERIKSSGEGVPYIANVVKYTPIWIHQEPKWVQVSYRKEGKVEHGMIYPGDAILLEMQPVDTGTT